MGQTLYTTKTALTGDDNTSLDSIDGKYLNKGDMALVPVSGTLCIYILDNDCSYDESYPGVISPNKNYGTKRWILQAIEAKGFYASQGAAASPIILLSGAADKFTEMTMGRTAAECAFGIAGNAAEFCSDSVAGDVVLRTDSSSKRLKLLAGTGAATLNVSNTDIYTIPWTDWTASAAWTGIDDWTLGWKSVAYKKIGKLVILNWSFGGHLNAGSAELRMTIPYAANGLWYGICSVANSGLWQAAPGGFKIDTSTLYFGTTPMIIYDDFAAAAGAVKASMGSAIYEATT